MQSCFIYLHHLPAKTLIAAIVLLLAIPATALAAGSLGHLLKQGVGEYEAGNYLAASESFEQAETLDPSDFRIPYNRGNALLGLGRIPQAIEAYRRAAESDDPSLAARALVRIGDLHVESAKKALGLSPEFAQPDAQAAALSELEEAIGEYEAALIFEPENTTARGNIERIRIWSGHIGKIWHEKDRNARQFKTPPLDYLEQLRKRVEGFRAEVAEFPKTLDSPKKFQRMLDISSELIQLRSEGKGIREMVNLFFETDPPLGSPGSTAEMGEVNALCGKLESSLQDAAAPLKKYQPERTSGSLAEALRHIDALQTLLKSYETILWESIAEQERLLSRTAAGTPEYAAEKSWEQGTLARRMPTFYARALQGLKFLDENPPSLPEMDPALPAHNEMAALAVKELMRFDKLKESMQLASSLLPEAELHMKNAEKEFRDGKWDDAELSCMEALEILRRIAEPLEEPPNDNPPQDQQQPNPEPKQSENPNEGAEQPSKDDSNPPENPETGKVDPDEAENASGDQPPKNDGSEESEEPEQPEQPDRTGENEPDEPEKPGGGDENESEANKPDHQEDKGGGDDSGEDENKKDGNPPENNGPGGLDKGPDEKEKERIDDLIRQVHRRRDEAERRREEYRKMLENRNRENIKDW